MNATISNKSHQNENNSKESSETTSNSYDVDERVKNSLKFLWNNIKYAMKWRSNFGKQSPVWILGKCYNHHLNNASTSSEDTFVIGNNLESCQKDFNSRLWFTYRREFRTLNGSNYNTDCGWGCMLRSGQMLIGQALIYHILGRDWRWIQNEASINERNEHLLHRQIIKWFGDNPSINSPFSIHSLVQISEIYGRKAGDWYGPSIVAHIFQRAFHLSSKYINELKSISLSVAKDGTVYIRDILDQCISESDNWKSLILLIPIRLGVDKMNAIYIAPVLALFQLKQCIGIIGGRPKHSLYFIGYQDDKLICLDPHYCQTIVDVLPSNFSVDSFHCLNPRKIPISKIDPSCCIGFYCNTRQDFDELVSISASLKIPVTCRRSNSSTEYSLFTCVDSYSNITHLNYTLSESLADTNNEDFVHQYPNTNHEFDVI